MDSYSNNQIIIDITNLSINNDIKVPVDLSVYNNLINEDYLDCWDQFVFVHLEKGNYKIKLPSGRLLYFSPIVKYKLIKMNSPLMTNARRVMSNDINFIDLSAETFSDIVIIAYIFYIEYNELLQFDEMLYLLEFIDRYNGNSGNSDKYYIQVISEIINSISLSQDPLTWTQDEIDNLYQILLYLITNDDKIIRVTDKLKDNSIIDVNIIDYINHCMNILCYYYPYTIYNINHESLKYLTNDILEKWTSGNIEELKKIEHDHTYINIELSIALDGSEIIRIPSILKFFGINYDEKILIELGKSVSYWYKRMFGKDAEKVKIQINEKEISINKYSKGHINCIINGIYQFNNREKIFSDEEFANIKNKIGTYISRPTNLFYNTQNNQEFAGDMTDSDIEY